MLDVAGPRSQKSAAGTPGSSTIPNSEETSGVGRAHKRLPAHVTLLHLRPPPLLSLTTLPGFLDGLGQLLVLLHTDP